MLAPELYPHQHKAVQDLDNGKILYGGVGSGKSLTAAAYYMENHKDRDVYVFTTAKKRDALDWEKEFIQFGVSTVAELSSAGKLTVDSWNNIGKYKHIHGAFMIMDEQRLVGSGAWVKAFLKMSRRNKWIILSATPGDTWLDYIPVFVANGFHESAAHFKRDHVVYNNYGGFPKVERYVNVGKLIKLRLKLLVEMPYVYHTTRHSIVVPVEHDAKMVDVILKDRWHPYEDRPIRNASEMFAALRKATYTDASRLEAVKGLMAKHPRLIVFYNFDYELESLRTLGESDDPGFSLAEWNGHKHQDVPETEKWVYLVQYTAGAEGWNCVTTDAMVFHTQTYSYKQLHQAHGRIDRLNTKYTDLHYYTLLSNSVMDKAVSASLREKKDFNERRFISKFGGFKADKTTLQKEVVSTVSA